MKTPCARSGCQATAADGLWLCRIDLHRLAGDAAKLAPLHTALGLVLAAAGSGGGGERSTEHAGLGLNGAAVALRAQIRQLLIATVAEICAAHGWELPCRRMLRRMPSGFIGPWDAPWTPYEGGQALAVYVATNATWLASQPRAAWYADEYAHLAARAAAVAYGERARVIHIGGCPHDGCGGQVSALVHPGDDQLPRNASCDWRDEHVWTAAEMPRLGRWMGIRQGRWQDAIEIGVVYGIKPRYVQQLASKHRWRRTEDRLRPVLYSAADVRATMTKLRRRDLREPVEIVEGQAA